MPRVSGLSVRPAGFPPAASDPVWGFPDNVRGFPRIYAVLHRSFLLLTPCLSGANLVPHSALHARPRIGATRDNAKR